MMNNILENLVCNFALWRRVIHVVQQLTSLNRKRLLLLFEETSIQYMHKNIITQVFEVVDA